MEKNKDTIVEPEVVIIDGDKVIVEEDTTAIVVPQMDYSNLGFKRVDFNRPETIMNYGAEVLNELANVVSTASKAANANEVEDSSFYDAVAVLRSFITNVDKVDEYQGQTPGLITRALMKFVPSVREKNTPRTYADERETLNSSIDALDTSVQREGENTYAEFQLTRDAINKMKVLILKLDKVIVVGRADAADFKASVVDVLEGERDALAEGTNEKVEKAREYNEKNMFYTTFLEQLDALGNAYVKFNNTISQWNIGQQTDFVLMREYQKYRTTEVPAMRAHGETVIKTRRQTRKIEKQHALYDAGNELQMATSDQINRNVQGVIDLERKAMDLTPQQYIASNLDKGLSLLEDAQKAKLVLMEENRRQVASLKETFAEYSDRLDAILALSPEAPTNRLTGGYQKRLGERPNPKKKKWF